MSNPISYKKEDISISLYSIHNATISIQKTDSGFLPSLTLDSIDKPSMKLLAECIPAYDITSHSIIIRNHSKEPISLDFEEDARAVARSERTRLAKLFYFKAYKLTGIDVKAKESNTSFSSTIRIRKNKNK